MWKQNKIEIFSNDWTKTTRVFGEEMKWHASWYTKNQDFLVFQNLFHQATMYQQFLERVIVKIKLFEFYRCPSLHKTDKSEPNQTIYSIKIVRFNREELLQGTCEKNILFVYKPFLCDMEDR